MEKRKLANSDVFVSPLAFGAWAIGGWMWGGADRKDALRAIQTSISKGISTIDTAPVYGFGLSEELVGEAIKGRRDKVEILTKYGLRWEGKSGSFFFASENLKGEPTDIYRYASREAVIKECENSLKRLGTDYIDLYQIHWPDPSTPVEETMEAVNILLKQGKIRAAGVCNYSRELMEEALKYTSLVSNQVPYSMINRKIEDELLPFCLEKKAGIIAYSPLQRGILTGKFTSTQTYKKGDTRSTTPWYLPENIVKINHFLNGIKVIADKRHVSLSQVVLNWTMHREGIVCVLAGARNPEQVLDNAGALDFVLSPDETELINRNLNKLKLKL